VTGQEDAFYQMCMVLPSIIQKAVDELEGSIVPHDTVIDELKELAKKQNIEDYSRKQISHYMVYGCIDTICTLAFTNHSRIFNA